MDLPAEMPVMTLHNTVLFPDAFMPIYIFEPRYRKMLASALQSHRFVCLALQRPRRSREVPSTIAGAGFIRACVTAKNGTSRLILQGVARVELLRVIQQRPFRIHSVKVLETEKTDSVVVDALAAKVIELVSERLQQQGELAANLPAALLPNGAAQQIQTNVGKVLEHLVKLELKDPGRLADLVSCALLSRPQARQRVLESVQIEQRLKRLIRCLIAEIRTAGRPRRKSDNDGDSDDVF